jgi:predicted DNA-binding transcriptional regulator AlpA
VTVKVGRPPTFRIVELVGVAEIAVLLGVSTQRVHQLAASPNFPKPVAVLSAGMIWQLSDIEQWMQSTGRAPNKD